MTGQECSQANAGRLTRSWRPPLWAAILVGLVTSALLIGLEPIGGDPDCMYRPIKTELARALSAGTLPYWSDRFGTGVPLIAESHVAAFYPPNWLLYGSFEVDLAYRLSMWIHMVFCAAATAYYAGRYGCGEWGSALAGIAFSLCGSQAIHATHEIHYCSVAYIPVCLELGELYAETGRARWLAWLAIASGFQWTIGHFQFQTWTACLVLVIGTWRVLADGRQRIRLLGLLAGVSWGLVIAVVQMWPSWQLASFVGQFDRSIAARSFFSFPPAHWAELALPRLFRDIRGGPMAPYWFAHQTTGYEAAFFVGTLPLILAFLGATRPRPALWPWFVIIVVSLMLATMPQWWPQGYAMFLKLPGLGFFRAPARYTLFASLGLSLLAGRGLDRSLPPKDFVRGLVAAIAFGVLAAAWGAWWTSRSAFAGVFDSTSLLIRFGLPFSVWLAALVAITQWRRGNLPACAILPLVAIELGALYYTTTTQWGWHVALPQSSPVLRRLADEDPLRLVGGDLQNYPIYAGAATATPYLGYSSLPPGGVLKAAGERAEFDRPPALRWLRRLGVTHQVWAGEIDVAGGAEMMHISDESLDRLTDPTRVQEPWTIVKLGSTFPPARVATRTQVFPDTPALIRRLAMVDEQDVAHYVAHETPEQFQLPQGHSAVVTAWDETAGVVEHDGPCILIVTRTYYPGWTALVNGDTQAVHPVDGGLQGVRIEGSGTSQVELSFRPVGGRVATGISLAALASAFFVIAAGMRNELSDKLNSRRKGMPQLDGPRSLE